MHSAAGPNLVGIIDQTATPAPNREPTVAVAANEDI